MSTSNCARVMCVMAVRVRAWVPGFEKVHALMKRIHITCNGKYTENCWTETKTSAKRARWLTLTRIPSSVWPIVSLL